jgi:type IV pilus assembly protein PilB
MLKRINFPYEPGKVPTLYKAVGCKKCNMIGYKGRMGVHEVMKMTETLERMTVEHASADELERQAILDGMVPLRQDGFAKCALGQTSVEEILRVIV